MVIEAVFELAEKDWFDLEDLGLTTHAEEESWYTSAEDIKSPTPTALPDPVVDNRANRRKRLSLSKELPEKLSLNYLAKCELNLVIGVELLLGASFDYEKLDDDQALAKAAKDLIAAAFQTLPDPAPINIQPVVQSGKLDRR